jgi:hypothetical protein
MEHVPLFLHFTGKAGSSSRLVMRFSIVTWCVYRLKLIVIAGLPFILSWAMAAPALLVVRPRPVPHPSAPVRQ